MNLHAQGKNHEAVRLLWNRLGRNVAPQLRGRDRRWWGAAPTFPGSGFSRPAGDESRLSPDWPASRACALLRLLCFSCPKTECTANAAATMRKIDNNFDWNMP